MIIEHENMEEVAKKYFLDLEDSLGDYIDLFKLKKNMQDKGYRIIIGYIEESEEGVKEPVIHMMFGKDF